jgi:AraC-like DNA-binding protein
VSRDTGRLSLDEVALRVGYESHAAFAKAFKRRFGITSGAYRGRAWKPPEIEVAELV